MRSMIDMDTVQIEITNACTHKCSNCTRFVGHIKKPFFMSFEQFKEAIDSMRLYPRMTGVMGGEPLLHPQFEKFCDYATSVIPRHQLGLWTCLPNGYEHYREVIVRTFGNIFINDHSRSDIMHHPFLVAAQDVVYNSPEEMFYYINNCFFQHSWSASINPRGAYFCEMAAAFAMLFSKTTSNGWQVDKKWWWKTPKDFREQIEEFCPKCGGAMCLKRRKSTDTIDDLSETNLIRLRNIDSPKIKAGKYFIHELQECGPNDELASYKDQIYRDNIAARYGIFLSLNKFGFNEPHLCRQKDLPKKTSIFEQYKTRFK